MSAGGPQRLPPLRVGALADGSGNAIFEFQIVPSTHVRWGIISCPLAPLSALFTFFDAAAGGTAISPRGTWGGPGGWGPVLVGAMLTPIVKASGLTPAVAYEMVWDGYEGDEGDAGLAVAGPIYPAAGATLVQNTPAGGGAVGGGLMGWALAEASSSISPEESPQFSGWTITSSGGVPPTTNGSTFTIPAGASMMDVLLSASLVFSGMVACWADLFSTSSPEVPNNEDSHYFADSTSTPQQGSMLLVAQIAAGDPSPSFGVGANDFGSPIDVLATVADGSQIFAKFLVFGALA